MPERPMIQPPSPGQTCLVFAAEDIFVAQGVNAGDALGLPAALCPGDHYEVEAGSTPLRLIIEGHGADQRVGAGSDAGIAGDPITTLARYALMDDRGYRVDLLLLRAGSRLFALPLSPIAIATEYVLVNVEEAPEGAPLSDLLCLSFGRGTMISKADGRQTAIEALIPGDTVLTRDHGAQAIRWVGRATLRAVGPFAPVIITAGALGNAGDLIVSQQHRMFLYQRPGRRKGPAEILVQARHLINDTSVFLRSGGFTDYFALVFDRHEIIYAEGIPVESLLVTEATISRLPPDLSDDMRARFPGLSQSQHFGTELGRNAAGAPAPRRPGPQVV
jgi:Hint domain